MSVALEREALVLSSEKNLNAKGNFGTKRMI